MSIDAVPPEDRVPLSVRRGHLHKRFDRLWKSGAMTRTQAYRWLASVMRLTLEEAHIGQFNHEQLSEANQHVAALEPKKTA